jgi:hypothetical protein
MVFCEHLERTLHRVGCRNKTAGEALTALLSHHGPPPIAQGPQGRLCRPLGGRSSYPGRVTRCLPAARYRPHLATHEELLLESARTLIVRATVPDQLPLPVQKELARAVRDSKHELKALELAGEGWRTVYDVTLHRPWVNSTPPKARISTCCLSD